jgi:nucleoid-associated protein YgaU
MQTYVRADPLTSNTRSTKLRLMRTRVRRRRRVVALVAGTALAWAMGGPVAEAFGLGDGPSDSSRVHVVRAGDTLWSIATGYEPAHDPREVVAAIQAANALDPGALVPGQRIVLPELG